MSVQVRRRREAASFLASFVGAQGELLVDTTNNRVQVHDGATPGGWPAARLADLPSAAAPLALAAGGTGVSAASAGALLAALGAVAAPAIRQTVQNGPAANGTPSFLPATSASLSLTAQNVASASPLTLTAARGFGPLGQVDAVTQLTSNPSWPGLAASATNYLFINAVTGAAGATTLAPVYEFGGAPSTAAGQFTFDTQAMAGTLGNGSAAVPAPLVFVGEAVTNAGAVTGTVAYAYNGTAVVAQAILALSTTYTLSHNIGVGDLAISAFLQAKVAEGGFAVGERLMLGGYNGNLGSGGNAYGTSFSATARTFSIITPATALAAVGKTTPAFAFTTANWSAGALLRRAW